MNRRNLRKCAEFLTPHNFGSAHHAQRTQTEEGSEEETDPDAKGEEGGEAVQEGELTHDIRLGYPRMDLPLVSLTLLAFASWCIDLNHRLEIAQRKMCHNRWRAEVCRLAGQS